MPKMKKLDTAEVEVPKVAKKRGRPKGAKEKVPTHQFVAKDGCKLETTIRNVSATCKHGYAMEYNRTIQK